jgi:hypothetical protein
MRQKVAIGCGLSARAPRAILLDEPLTGLDPRGIRTMKATIRARAEAGAAVMVSSHLLSLVEDLCTTVLMLNHGRTVLRGRLDDLRRQIDADGRRETWKTSSSGSPRRPHPRPCPPPGPGPGRSPLGNLTWTLPSGCCCACGSGAGCAAWAAASGTVKGALLAALGLLLFAPADPGRRRDALSGRRPPRTWRRSGGSARWGCWPTAC